MTVISFITAKPAATSASNPLLEISSRLESYGNIAVNWMQTHWFELMVAAIMGGLIYTLLSFLRRRAASIADKSADPFALKSIAMRTLGKTSRFFRIMVSAELVNEMAQTPAPISRVVVILFTISAVMQAAIWLREIILGLLERRVSEGGAQDETLSNAMVLIRLLVSFALFAIAAILILDNLGVNVTGLIAGLGVGGIAIGLAAQGIFSDLFAAIAIILDKPFKNGEVVQFGTHIATVEKIGMKSTRLRSVTGEQLIISNAKLLEMEITNFTQTNYRRTKYPIGVIYQTPPEKARAIPALLQQIVEREGGVFVRAGFVGFGDSSIDFELLFDILSADFEEIFAGRHRVGIAIIEAFAQEGLEFAYPTQTTFTAAPDGEMIMPYAAIPQNRSVRAKK
ncbi:mechanosensitive ion channel family protein [Sphingorhabdus arenilitoris]|uniref:Mechanosensitive ion channel family protein n=1 Tax=Sphingorhabdus arenilitoris TaxID=1490041 RepID=A0ABV8RJX6_9SPHN